MIENKETLLKHHSSRTSLNTFEVLSQSSDGHQVE